MAYLPNGAAERQQMLDAIGAASVEDLFASVPARLRHPRLNLPPPLAEQDLVAELERLAARNHPLGELDSFLGAGVYRRYVPAIVRAAVARPEFYTAYTPYQAEASQGTLQTIFEFQSMICGLTGLEVANASLYDGASAAAEAAMMAVAQTGRRRVVAAADLNPETLSVIRTYARGRKVEVVTTDGVGDAVGPEDACAVVAQPGFLGTVDDPLPVAEAARAAGAVSICCADPIACALLVPPGELGFDIAVGDGQPLGIPPSFGGPHLGFMAVRQELMRRMPGRLVGQTHDHHGRRAYALTLQAREQHIRREKATSNICTNHALTALAATVYMARMGAGGMRRVAEVSVQRAHHLAKRLTGLEGIGLAEPDRPYLWEFAIRVPGDAEVFAAALRREGIVAGLPLGRVDPRRGDQLLVCCTETTSAASIDRYVAAAARIAEPAGVGA
ncbi:MAG: aminomethyl-transferring glycine dehydrogenase subunit GcvPA [Candidatus Dormiibacterota bacterium]|jgi:glycine dehydrogenase subunit 1